MRKAILSIVGVLLAGVVSAQPIGVKVWRDDTNSRILVKADDGQWLSLYGSGAPTFTTFLSQNVPQGAIYFNTATATPYYFSSGSWTASSGGSASSIVAGTTTAGTCASKFVVGDSSNIVQCPSSLAAFTGGAGGGTMTFRDTAGNAQQTLVITGTTSTGTGTQYGVALTITGAGTGNGLRAGFNSNLVAGYTGTYITYALGGSNTTAGTGTVADLYADGFDSGVFGQAVATTTNSRVGVYGRSAGGSLNAGVVGGAAVDKASTQNIGVHGWAAAASGNAIGGYFAIGNSASFVSPALTAALVVDNRAIAAPIAVFQDNSVTKVQIRDGGTLAGMDAVGGTDSDTAGGALVTGGGLGTGTGAGGDVQIQRSPDIATGTTIQTAADAVYVRSKKKALSAGAATAFARVNLASGVAAVTGWGGGTVFYTLVANDASDFQSRSGYINFSVVNKAGTETCAFAAIPTESVANSSGTTTLTFDTDTAGPTNGCDLRATGASSLTETTLSFFWSIVLQGPVTVTPQ